MAVGYLDPLPVERVRAARRQVLVVVTASWQVGEAGEATRCRVVNVEVVLGVCQCHDLVLLMMAMQLGDTVFIQMVSCCMCKDLIEYSSCCVCADPVL